MGKEGKLCSTTDEFEVPKNIQREIPRRHLDLGSWGQIGIIYFAAGDRNLFSTSLSKCWLTHVTNLRRIRVEPGL